MAGFSEFELIKRYFSSISYSGHDSILLGVGDDCGVVSLPPGQTMCFSVDTMVEGIHFPFNAPAFEVAYRSLAAAMSDLAAMGAKPFFFTLALTLPEINSVWLSQFSAGLKALADQFQFPLLGGDTTKGPLTISIQVHGLLDRSALKRSSAKAGDILAVSGTLGDAGAALDLLKGKDSKDRLSAKEAYLLDRYYKPSPRIMLGEAILPFANACIDISDGLLAEASHISEQSSVRLDIDSLLLPLSKQLIEFKGKDEARALALSAGDDYELLFTMPESDWNEFIMSIPEGSARQIGRVREGFGVYLDGKNTTCLKKGYQHFD